MELKLNIQKDLALLIGIVVILLVLPVFLYRNSYIMHILIMCMIWSCVVIQWDLIMGYAGIFTFGQIAFFVVGAYATGMLTKQLGISPWLGIICGGMVVAVVGIALAIPCLRMRGVYVALVTFAFHMILDPMIKLGRPIGTGGSMSLSSIPPLSIAGYTFTVTEKLPWYYLILVVSGIIYFISHRIIRSSLGLAFIAMRDSEPFARTLGVNYFKLNLTVFAISSFFTGIIGGFYIEYVGMVSTRLLGIDTFLVVMVMLIVGGMGQFPGVIIGAFAVTVLSEVLRPLEVYRRLFFGAIVIALVVYMPQGLMGVVEKFEKKFIKKD